MIARYFSRRIFAVLIMGFSSGLPLALVGSTLQAWFTEDKVNILTIGCLSLIGIPYTFKFLWAPLLDRYLPPFLGRRRGWILITQLGVAATLCVLSFLQPSTHSKWVGGIALLIAFLSASQDIAYDAYRTDVLRPGELGLGATALSLGYRVAMLASGGGALIIADYWGWKLMYELMAILMCIVSIGTFFAPDPICTASSPKTLVTAVVEPFKELLQRENIFFILLFILLYKVGDALALSLMTNFLLQKLSFTLTDIGLVFKTVGLAATILGAFLGGLLLTRMRIIHALLYFGLLQAFSNICFMFLALSPKNYLFMTLSIFIEQFCSGMSTVAFVAYIMSLCDRRYTATQYALLSALTAVGRVLVGPFAAIMVENLGWVSFYGWATLASFPALILLIFLRRVKNNAEVAV